MEQIITVHSSLDIKVIAIYPSIEKPNEIAVLIRLHNNIQEVRYLKQL